MKILAAISILGWASLCTVLAMHFWPKPKTQLEATVPVCEAHDVLVIIQGYPVCYPKEDGIPLNSQGVLTQ